MPSLRPAITYWAAIFALGFVLGALRVAVIAPALGDLVAVMLELPVILCASWILARVLVRRHRLSARTALAMGALAFILLMASEAALAALLSGDPLGQWFAAMMRPAGLVGLAGQVLFGLLPWWAAHRQASASREP